MVDLFNLKPSRWKIFTLKGIIHIYSRMYASSRIEKSICLNIVLERRDLNESVSSGKMDRSQLMFFLSLLVGIDYSSHGSPGIGRVMNLKRKALSMFIFFQAFLLPHTQIPWLDPWLAEELKARNQFPKMCPPSLIYSWMCALKRVMEFKSIWGMIVYQWLGLYVSPGQLLSF